MTEDGGRRRGDPESLATDAPPNGYATWCGSALSASPRGLGGRLIADSGDQKPIQAAISRFPEPKPEPIRRRGLLSGAVRRSMSG